MKAINKSLELATAYKSWIEKLDNENKLHPPYNSSTNEYYYDIVANLLWVQQGLCAYTEMYLIDKDKVNPKLWKNGRFNRFQFLGQLDHYDASLKEQKAWDWNNFFMIHSDVNTKHKRSKSVNYLLKPDKGNFSPFYFLDYDVVTHFFIPNVNRDQEMITKIQEDIFSLGLNFEPISDYRRIYLKPIFEEIELGICTVDVARQKLNKFYTAFEMAITQFS